jgi:hypothetical protein
METPATPVKEHNVPAGQEAPSTVASDMDDLFDFGARETPAATPAEGATPTPVKPIEKILPGEDPGKKEHHVPAGAETAPVEPVPSTVAPDPDEEYRAKMNDLAAKAMQGEATIEPAPVAAPVTPTVPVATPAPVAPAAIPMPTMAELFTDADFAALGEQPTTAQLLNAAYKKMWGHIQGEFKKQMEENNQTTLRALPPVIANTVDERVNIRLATQDFYAQNADLKRYSKFVAYTAQQLFTKNPDKSVEDVFSLLGKEVREQLKIKTAAPVAQPAEGSDPGFAGGVRARKPVAPAPTGVQGEMAELFGWK